MLHRTLRVLFEIRLCWSDEVIEEPPFTRGGLWIPETERTRDRLEQAADWSNRLYGDDTHWIEKRQA